MIIVNLTQHESTKAQIKAGVVNVNHSTNLSALLTFDEIPSKDEMVTRAHHLIDYVGDADAAMIGGAPFFMPVLEAELLAAGIKPLYAFSQRVSEDQVQPDGSVRKVAVFKHLGFVGL